MHKIERHIHSFFEKLPPYPIFAAVSGGLDSMVLLHAMHQLKKDLTVLHVNYQLRGTESNLDERLVRETCQHYGIPLKVMQVDMKQYLKEHGGNLQEEARNVRYAFFSKQVAHQPGWIALAHHSDDQVETFFLQLGRKAGIMGLSCMLPVHGEKVRPLLSFDRSELQAYALQHRIKWREDASNGQLHYRRNLLRNVLIPEMEVKCSPIKQQVLCLIDAFQQTQLAIQEENEPLVERIKAFGTLPFSEFDLLKEEGKIELLRQLGLPLSLLDDLNKLRKSQKGKKLFTEGGDFNIIFRESDSFYFQGDAVTSLPELVVEKVQMLPKRFDKQRLFANADNIEGQLQLRKWRLKDRMKPVGMAGSKLISDILNDAKVPAHQRENQFVVEDERKIIWCVGHCISREVIPEGAASVLSIMLKH